MKYAVVYEREGGSVGAYVPDLPGCVAVGDSFEEAEKSITEVIAFHLEGCRKEGISLNRALFPLDSPL